MLNEQPHKEKVLEGELLPLKPFDSTSALLAFKSLNHDIDEEWVQWAQEMIAIGFDTEHLRILAGASKPFNQFEMHELTDQVLAELNLDYRDQDKVLKDYARYLINLFLNGNVDSLKTLESLKNVFLQSIDKEYLRDFYTLWNAKIALMDDTHQWYWDGATRENIEDIITNNFIQWKKLHYPAEVDFEKRQVQVQPTSNAVTLKLIHSKMFRRLFPFLTAIFLISWFSILIPMPIIWAVILSIAGFAVPPIVGIYSQNFKREGYLSIDEENVVLARNENLPRIFPIGMLQHFKISRGATVHHYDDDTYPHTTHDNWISFTYHGHAYKAEFSIKDREENEKFEEIVRKLRRKYPDFYYESI